MQQDDSGNKASNVTNVYIVNNVNNTISTQTRKEIVMQP